MAMVVKNNMSAVNTLNTLNKNQSLLGKSLQKVSSGMKINSAQDDASGYAISERMRVMIRSLDQANQNTQNGSSLMKVAEGAVSNTVEILKTLKEKAINAATDTNSEEDRAIIQKEINQLVDQIDDNALITFNGKYLLDGSKSAAGVATYNAWTNQALAENTSALTKLTELQARGGEKLTIESTDKVTVSYVQNGKTYTTTAAVSDVKTLGGVFRLAEKIDENSTTFATSANESVAEAGGLIAAATNKDVVDKTVAYLQDALSFSANSSPGSSLDSDAMIVGNTFISVTIADTSSGDLASATLVTETAVAKLSDTTLSMVSNGIGSATGLATTYNGDLFAAVKETYDNYNTLVNKMGDADSGMGLLLKTQLEQELGIDWDGKEGVIKDYKPQIYDVGSEQLIQYYEDYTSASAAKAEAQDAMNAAIKDYNRGLAQLDALVKLQALETEKVNYTSAVDSFLSALQTEMSGKQEGSYTLAAGTAGNPKQLTFEAGNSQLSDSDRSAAIKAITTALKEKLYDLADEAMLDLTNLAKSDDESFKNAVIALIGDGAGSAATAGITYTGTAGSAVLGTGGTYTGSTLITPITDYVANMKTAAAEVEAARPYLELAQNNALEEYTGPAILTGSNVGLDPAGKIVTTLDGTAGLTFTAANSGADGQISGFTISISDSEGNVRKSVNTSLNAWSTTVYGKNASEKDNSLAFQIGASANQTITVDMADMRAEALGLRGKDGKVVDVSTKENANAAISVFENALQKALDVQTTVGAIEARLEYTASNLTTSTENVQAAESTIRDADMAKEMTNYTKNNVLLQAAQSMLAQANQNSSAVLSLLQ